MKVDWVTVGPFQENTYLLSDPATGSAVLVDPGDEPERILRMAREAGANIEAIWLTHAHIDHIGAVAAVKREWNVPVLLHADDLLLYRQGSRQAAIYGLPFEQPVDPDGPLAHGDVLSLRRRPASRGAPHARSRAGPRGVRNRRRHDRR